MKVLKMTGTAARAAAKRYVDQAPEGHEVVIREPKRSLEANALMWAILTEFAEQLEWPVNGTQTRLEPEEWKDVLSAAFQQEHVRLAAGLNGGVVMLGQRTSQFSKRKMADFIDWLYMVGADKGVRFHERAAA